MCVKCLLGSKQCQWTLPHEPARFLLLALSRPASPRNWPHMIVTAMHQRCDLFTISVFIIFYVTQTPAHAVKAGIAIKPTMHHRDHNTLKVWPIRDIRLYDNILHYADSCTSSHSRNGVRTGSPSHTNSIGCVTGTSHCRWISFIS